jgi:hypothetical protein
VTGLAVHPDLDLIATTDGGVTTLFSLGADQGAIHWSTDAGTVFGPPAIGAASADAPIYTANLAGVISAFVRTGECSGRSQPGTSFPWVRRSLRARWQELPWIRSWRPITSV